MRSGYDLKSHDTPFCRSKRVHCYSFRRTAARRPTAWHKVSKNLPNYQ